MPEKDKYDTAVTHGLMVYMIYCCSTVSWESSNQVRIGINVPVVMEVSPGTLNSTAEVSKRDVLVSSMRGNCGRWLSARCLSGGGYLL